MAEQKKLIDPDNYSELSKPFESAADANKAINDFWGEFYELRNKHKLQDVHVIVGAQMKYDSGDVGQVMVSMHAGNELMIEGMCAWALGKSQAERQERIGDLLAQAIRVPRNKK